LLGKAQRREIVAMMSIGSSVLIEAAWLFFRRTKKSYTYENRKNSTISFFNFFF